VRLRREFKSLSTPVQHGSATLHIHSLSSRSEDGGRSEVVLLPGLGASPATMLPVARLLPQDRGVHIVDLLAFREGERPPGPLSLRRFATTAAAWLRAIGCDRAAWIGHSFGSQIVVQLAFDRAAVVEKLALISPTVDPRRRSLGRQFACLLLDATHEPRKLLTVLFRDYLRLGPRALLQIGELAVSDPVEQKLPSIEAQALILRGGRDPLVPQCWAEEMESLLRNGRLVVIAGGTHAVQYQSASTVAKELGVFLGSSGATRLASTL
jgi:2-hydroxy-6-oxonona-2,4-dienedioate hydrolase